MLQSPAQRDLASMPAQLRAVGESPRYWEINDLEALWRGLDPKGRPSFWDSSVPLRERAPIVRGYCAQIAATRVVPLVFGEGRFPALTVGGGDSDLSGIGLSPADANVLTGAAEFCVKQARLRLLMRQALEHGLMARTAVGVVSLRAGKLRLDLLPAKECAPKFHAVEDDRVTRLERRYRYPDPDSEGDFLFYRRVITETEDRTWINVPCDDKGRDPKWDAYPSTAFAVPFCPVVWMRNLPEPGAVGEIDGVAFFEGKEAEVEAVDRSCSQRHRNALFNGDPQTFITGAGPEDVIGERGREAINEKTAGAGMGRWFVGSRGALDNTSGGGTATKKAPGRTVFLKKEGADVKQVESSGAGAEILSKDIAALEKTLFDAVGVVVVGPSDVAGDASGEMLAKLSAPMLAVCDNLRECWGDALVRVVGMMLRMIAAPANRRAADGASRVMLLPQPAALLAILDRFNVAIDGPVIADASAPPVTTWMDPPFDLKWGPYFAPSNAQKLAAVQAVGTAVADKIMTLRTAVQDLAPLFGVRDVEGEITELHGATAADQDRVAGMIGSIAGPPTSADPTAPAAASALNGAQISSLLEVVQLVATGAIPRETGMAIIVASFPIDRVQADGLMGTVGNGFVPSAKSPQSLAAPTAPNETPLSNEHPTRTDPHS